MISINSTDARDYCRQGTNILAASVHFAITGTDIVITDNTTYVYGESLANMQISFFDHFGGKIETQFTDGDSPFTVDASSLNTSEGVNSIVTVISDQGNVKDGSAFDLFTMRQDGDYNIEA